MRRLRGGLLPAEIFGGFQITHSDNRYDRKAFYHLQRDLRPAIRLITIRRSFLNRCLIRPRRGEGHRSVGIIRFGKCDLASGIGQLAHGSQRIAEEVFRIGISLRDSSQPVGVGDCPVTEDLSQASAVPAPR